MSTHSNSINPNTSFFNLYTFNGYMAEYISLNSMENILREAGAERVSHGAKKALSEHIEKQALQIAKKSLKLTKHAERKTIKEEDIHAAITL